MFDIAMTAMLTVVAFYIIRDVYRDITKKGENK